MASEGEGLAVKTAIDLTLRTIEGRVRLYRTLLAAVSVLLVGSAVATVVFWSWWPLAGLALIVPATGGCLVQDGRLINQWMLAILSLRDTQAMSLQSFSSSLLEHSLIPKGTIEGMLTTLRISGCRRTICE